jgi:hypothetical protein
VVEPVLGLGDSIAAHIEWLAGDSAIVEATTETNPGDLIFGHELPLNQANQMPRSCIVVSDAGGFTEGLPEVLDRSRVDVRAYGRTMDEAKRLAVLVRLRMKTLTRWTSSLGLVLHAPRPAGGYIPLREPAGGWPLVLRSYLTVYDETLVA